LTREELYTAITQIKPGKSQTFKTNLSPDEVIDTTALATFQTGRYYIGNFKGGEVTISCPQDEVPLSWQPKPPEHKGSFFARFLKLFGR
jgi:hypothetical protein